MAKTIEVHIKNLTTKFDVRKKLNDSHVLNLAYLYEAGEELPPLVITKQMEIVDGRHRKAAMELAGREVAHCVIAGETDDGALIVSALKANVGGALPPTQDDIVHSIVLLFNQGWTEKKILDNLPFPRVVGRKYAKTAWGIILNAKLTSAMKAISEDGITMKTASERFGVPEEKLKEHLNPNRKREKQKTVAWRKNHISRAYQGFHRKIAYEIQALSNSFEEQQVSEEEALAVFEHIFESIRKGEKRVEEHRERFQNLARDFGKLAEIKS